ncbi:MAG: hypothetical protein M0004_07830 [Actinomycetota bacterium]|nr:hypothetical protein [Actinomycetota bacterium]
MAHTIGEQLVGEAEQLGVSQTTRSSATRAAPSARATSGVPTSPHAQHAYGSP